MKIKICPFEKSNSWVFVCIMAGMLSCDSENGIIKPNVEARLSEKWWCDNKQLLADQLVLSFYGADNTIAAIEKKEPSPPDGSFFFANG